MQNTFLWHDYETFGSMPRSDRPAQFAGIRTDLELNEVGQPVMTYCKPSFDMFPSPESCLITGITPQHCQQYGVTEREFAAIIERELSAPNTIGAGFNNIRFDDEITRFLFWRNLMDPYAREWKNGCSRWDLLDVVRALYALKPNALSWPLTDTGMVSLKLEALSKENSLHHDSAHDALSDVKATIALARLIKKLEPRLFDFCLRLRHKEQVKAQVSLYQKRPVLHISGMYGAERAYLAIVWPLAQHPLNKNEILVWDLQENPNIIANLSPEEVKSRLFTPNDELPTDISRLPVKSIHINKSPIVVNDLRVLSNERAHQLNINVDKIHQHAEIAKTLQLNPALWNIVYAKNSQETVDVDEDLYGSFVPDVDRCILEKLRGLTGNELASQGSTFHDKRLKELVFRYRARNFPDTLNASELLQWHLTCHQKIEPKIQEFNNNLDVLRQKTDRSKLTIIEQLQDWACFLEEQLA